MSVFYDFGAQGSPKTYPCYISRFPRHQGALEALKLSQELLLRIHRQRQGHRHGTDSNNVPETASTPQDTTAAAATATQAQPRQGATAIATATTAAATPAQEEGQRPGAGARPSSTDAHVHELAAQASKLRGMSGNVKRLLEIAAGEVQGALEDTRDSLGVAASASTAAAAATKVVGTQTQEESVGRTKAEVDALERQLCDATAAARALEVEKSRLDGELGTAAGELAKFQELLREKTAEVRCRGVPMLLPSPVPGSVCSWSDILCLWLCCAPTSSLAKLFNQLKVNVLR